MPRLALAAVALTACGRIGIEGIGNDGPAHDVGTDDGLVARFLFANDVVADTQTASSVNAFVGKCDQPTPQGPQYSCPSGGDTTTGRPFASGWDGQQDCIPFDYDARFDLPAAGSVAVWIRIQPPENFSLVSVIEKIYGTQLENTWGIAIDPSSMEVDFTTAPQSSLRSTTALSPDTWTHVAITWDSVTKHIYVAGVLAASEDVGPLEHDGGAVTIGCDIDHGSPTDYYGGLLSDLRIYNRALSPADVALLAQP
ncbi:MAG TPA: LamG domain-containing protein [Kofleriaceae bacterium]